MSDSVRPHRRQPTRLLCPWDSPGKNTGVGCHFLLQCMKVKSETRGSQKWDVKMGIKGPRTTFFLLSSPPGSAMDEVLLNMPLRSTKCHGWYTPALLARRFTPPHPRKTDPIKRHSEGTLSQAELGDSTFETHAETQPRQAAPDHCFQTT